MTVQSIHEQEYEVISWDDFGKLCFDVSKKIIESGQKFDRIIGLAKGGLPIMRSIADHIGVSELSSIQIEFYTGIGTTAKTPVITQSLPVRIQGERVLIIDDVVDTGETLLLAKLYLNQHGATELKTASIVSKPWTKDHPDYFAHVSKSWVVFPWEARETIQLLSTKWSSLGDSQSTIRENFLHLGYSTQEIDFFKI